MKKLFTFIAIASIFIGTLQAQDLSEILENYYETNGQEKMSKVKTVTMTGRIFQMGSEFKFTRIGVRPNKFHLEADVMGQKFIQSYDGSDGWMIAPWTGSTEPQDMPADQLKSIEREANMDGVLFNYEERGITLEYEGIEDVEGSDAYKIKATYEDGDIITNFIDVESYVIIKTEALLPTMTGGEALTSTYLSNYKMIDGTAVPFSMETKQNGQVTAQINLDTVEYDKEVDDKIFTRPIK